MNVTQNTRSGETPNGYVTLRYTQAPYQDVGVLQPPMPKYVLPVSGEWSDCISRG